MKDFFRFFHHFKFIAFYRIPFFTFAFSGRNQNGYGSRDSLTSKITISILFESDYFSHLPFSSITAAVRQFEVEQGAGEESLSVGRPGDEGQLALPEAAHDVSQS